MVGDLTRIDPDLSAIVDLTHHEVDLFGSSSQSGVTLRQRPPLPDLLSELRSYSGVITHPSLSASTSDEAALLLNLARSGVPVIGRISTGVRAILPAGLSSTIESGSLDDLFDSEKRDLLSIRQRRRAWHGNFPTPPVSVVISTNRPEFLQQALSQATQFDYPDFETVVVAHGFSPDGHAGDSRVIEVPAAMPFGQALDFGFTEAKGEIITKFDDDDWYAVEHLSDLACSLHYSGVSMVAKAAEFVYLAPLDITIRRMASGSETYDSRNVAGGTLFMARDLYETIGGWRPINRHVDQALLDDAERLGIHWYRTHGHGYVLHRRSEGHTWDASVDYFLDASVVQYRGLAKEPSLLAE